MGRAGRALVCARDAETAGQQQWHQLARQAAVREKQMVVLPAAAYGGYKDVNEAWGALPLRTSLMLGWPTP
jgi:hypothetical protein